MTGYDIDREVAVVVVDKETGKTVWYIDSVPECESENVRDNMAAQYPQYRAYIEGQKMTEYTEQLEMDEVENAEWDEFVLTLAREQGIVDFLTEVEEAQNG